MAAAMRCDICGGYFEYAERDANNFAFRHVRHEGIKTTARINEQYDICPECREVIAKTIGERLSIEMVAKTVDEVGEKYV